MPGWKAGELGLDFYGLRDKLGAMGVEWVETAGLSDRPSERAGFDTLSVAPTAQHINN